MRRECPITSENFPTTPPRSPRLAHPAHLTSVYACAAGWKRATAHGTSRVLLGASIGSGRSGQTGPDRDQAAAVAVTGGAPALGRCEVSGTFGWTWMTRARHFRPKDTTPPGMKKATSTSIKP